MAIAMDHGDRRNGANNSAGTLLAYLRWLGIRRNAGVEGTKDGLI